MTAISPTGCQRERTISHSPKKVSWSFILFPPQFFLNSSSSKIPVFSTGNPLYCVNICVINDGESETILRSSMHATNQWFLKASVHWWYRTFTMLWFYVYKSDVVLIRRWFVVLEWLAMGVILASAIWMPFGQRLNHHTFQWYSEWKFITVLCTTDPYIRPKGDFAFNGTTRVGCSRSLHDKVWNPCGSMM